jgi:predicted phosphodiesterase
MEGVGRFPVPRPLRLPRRALALAAVVLAAIASGLGALAVREETRSLSAGDVRISVELDRRGLLDLYVPLLDWGVRFDAVTFPARVIVEARTVDRDVAARIASGSAPDADALRAEAHDALAGYLRNTILVTVAVAALGGALVALAVRAAGPRPAVSLGTAAGTALALGGVLALTLPPRGALDRPTYYGHGGDLPVALRALQRADLGAERLGDELDAQLGALAGLITAPADRPDLTGLPRLVVASDLHNNVLAVPALRRAAEGLPVLFAGDLTDRGTPAEERLAARVATAGSRVAFVTGNHDSDGVARAMAAQGAVVLTERGRLLPSGRTGPVVARVGGLRVAGYGDPFRRRPGEAFEGAAPEVTPAQRRDFWHWLRPLIGRVDAVMVHSPGLAELAVRRLRRDPPPRPLLLATGHTHDTHLETGPNLVELNGGTVGGGGPANAGEGRPVGLAMLTYRREPRFAPLAVDLVEIDVASGSARAERTLLEDAGG